MDDDVITPAFPPLSATVQVTFGARSRRGTLNAENEDHYLILELGRHQQTLMTSLPEDVVGKRFDEYGYAMVVADGVGGNDSGERASRLALETLMHLVLHFSKWNLRIDHDIAREVMDRARRFYRHVDNALLQRSGEGVTSLQTTLTAVFGAGNDLFFAHVGHSRAYLFRDSRLMRLTRDHTIGRARQTRVPMAPLVDVNAVARDLKHILTDTLGGGVGPQVDLERFRLNDGDIILVCTNGLTDMVDEDAVAGVLASDRSPDEQCQMLIDLTLGGPDDATALIARYNIPK